MASFDSGYFSVDAFDEDSFDFSTVVIVSSDPGIGFWMDTDLIGFKSKGERLDFITQGSELGFKAANRLDFCTSGELLHFKSRNTK